MGAARHPGAAHPRPDVSQLIHSTVLAFDYGARRIGMAVGDTALGIAHPVGVIEARAAARRWERIRQAITEWRPALLVVGLPVRDDGSEHELAPRVRDFSAQLARRFALEVRLIDERYTSAEAASRLSEAGVHGRAQKRHLDELAAAAILQAYFDRERTPA
ncbi:MAG TPA: Holliday junction resolvase RuvX [Burkholderiales bacterium]|nr:Holliday junction resolvase RuvX [Burkholderiales bacterium]